MLLWPSACSNKNNKVFENVARHCKGVPHALVPSGPSVKHVEAIGTNSGNFAADRAG